MSEAIKITDLTWLYDNAVVEAVFHNYKRGDGDQVVKGLIKFDKVKDTFFLLQNYACGCGTSFDPKEYGYKYSWKVTEPRAQSIKFREGHLFSILSIRCTFKEPHIVFPSEEKSETSFKSGDYIDVKFAMEDPSSYSGMLYWDMNSGKWYFFNYVRDGDHQNLMDRALKWGYPKVWCLGNGMKKLPNWGIYSIKLKPLASDTTTPEERPRKHKKVTWAALCS